MTVVIEHVKNTVNFDFMRYEIYLNIQEQQFPMCSWSL